LVLDVPDNGLAALMHMHVLNRDLLLALAAVTIERFEQRGATTTTTCSPPTPWSAAS
jgi:hypothetical protein